MSAYAQADTRLQHDQCAELQLANVWPRHLSSVAARLGNRLAERAQLLSARSVGCGVCAAYASPSMGGNGRRELVVLRRAHPRCRSALSSTLWGVGGDTKGERARTRRALLNRKLLL